MTIRSTFAVIFGAVILALPGAATAQVIGTFSWQTQPYCNVVTVELVQQGPLYQVLGTDDLCGAGTAPVTGTAVVVGSGVAFGMTAALPTGRPVHLSATISIASVSGTWSDADGNSGPFAFGVAVGGSPRPAPASAAAITVAQLGPTVYGGTGAANTVARSDHDHDARYYTKAEIEARTLETVTTNFAVQSFNFVAERILLSESFTTTRSGHLSISKLISELSVVCTATFDARVAFLRVDGVALKSSALVVNTSSVGSTRLVGVTDAIVPAGVHSVDVAFECSSASTAGVASFVNFTNTSVVVLP